MKGGAAAGFVSWLFYRFEITEHVPRLVAASLQGQARLKTSCLRFGDCLNSLDCSNSIGPYH